MVKSVTELNSILNPTNTKYSGFFDETFFENGDFKDLKCYLFVLTSESEKIENFISKTVRENKLSEGKLHFSTQLKNNKSNLIKKILLELNSFKIICFYGFIDENTEQLSAENKGVKRNNRINQFGYDFTRLFELGSNELEVIFYHDKGYLDNKQFIKSKVLVLKENTENQKHYELIPNNVKYRERIKGVLKEKKPLIILEFSRIDSKSTGLQVADYLLGAFRQLLTGNDEYYQLVKNRFYNNGCNFNLRGRSIYL